MPSSTDKTAASKKTVDKKTGVKKSDRRANKRNIQSPDSPNRSNRRKTPEPEQSRTADDGWKEQIQQQMAQQNARLKQQTEQVQQLMQSNTTLKTEMKHITHGGLTPAETKQLTDIDKDVTYRSTFIGFVWATRCVRDVSPCVLWRSQLESSSVLRARVQIGLLNIKIVRV